MESTDVKVSREDGVFLTPYLGRIEECFDVKIEHENVAGTYRDANRDQAGGEEVEEGASQTRLKLSANSPNNVQSAKTFLESVTGLHAGPCERHLTLSPEQFTALQGFYDVVEKETQTVFLFSCDARTVSILGQAPSVSMAQQLATNRLQDTEGSVATPVAGQQKQENHSPKHPRKKTRVQRAVPTLTVQMGLLAAQGGAEEGAAEDSSRMTTHAPLSLSPGAESSHDSCYDSDGSLSGSRRSSCARSDSDLHNDVSRTVSDTLAAEHSENESGGSGSKGSPPSGTTPTSIADPDSVINIANTETEMGEISRDPLVKQETQEFSLSSTCADVISGNVGGNGSGSGQPRSLSDSIESLEADPMPVVGMSGLSLTTTASGTNNNDIVDQDEEDVEDDDELKVRYGIRLGYSQELTRKVLEKLGSSVKKDDLLSELIKHTEDEKEDEDEEQVDCPWVLNPSSTVSTTIPNASSPISADRRLSDGSIDGKLPLVRTPSDAPMGSKDNSNLRPIIIDGSNIAMSHGNKQVFSCRGIRLAVDYFRERGHEKITVFVPLWRKEASRQDTQIVDQEVLYELEKEKCLVFTPSRWVGGKRIVCYDDLYIIKLAAEDDGIVVSNDNYRDLINKSPDYKKVIEERLLMYSFVDDRFMPPDDPLGRHGPSLDNFLSKQPVTPEPLPPACPYGKKCTYGNKCKYYHPERGSAPRKSVLEVLQEKERVEMEKGWRKAKSRESSPGDIGGSRSPTPSEKPPAKKPLSKTQSLVPGSKPPQSGKAQLTRTKSLAAGTLGSSSHATPLVDPLQSKPSQRPVLHSNDLQGATGGCMVTVTTAQSFDAASELKRKNYDEKLSNFRRRVEQDEAERLRAMQEATFSDGKNLESLQPPPNAAASWSSVQHDGLRPPKPLRPTNSDPQDVQYESSCGHLSLAKKLSDEGSKQEEKRRVQLGQTLSSPVVSPYTSPVRQRDEPGSSNGHRKLERQLSLQGSEDPRLQMKVVRTGQKHKKGENRSNVKNTRFEFHGPAMPPTPHAKNRQQQWYPKDNKVHRTERGTTFQFGDLSTVPPPSHPQHHHPLHATLSHPQQQHHTMVAINQHDLAAEHAAVTRHHSFGRESLIADHLRAVRMASAPGTFSYQTIGSNGNGSQGPQHRSSMIMPTIHRQNSTSDPQLHIHQDSGSSQFGDMDGRAAMPMYSHHPTAASAGRRGFGGAGGEAQESMLWNSQCRSFEGPIGSGGSNMKGSSSMFEAHLHLPGTSAEDRLTRGGSFEGHIPGRGGSFDNAIHPSGSFEDIGSGILHGMEKSRSFEGQLSGSDMGHQYMGGNMDMGSMPPYYQHQQQQHQQPQHQQQMQHQEKAHCHQDFKPYGSDQSLFMPGRMQMASPVENYNLPTARMLAPRKSSPDIYLLPQTSPPQPQPPQPAQQQDIFSTQMGHRLANSISPVLVGGESGLQLLPTSAPSPPHPDDQPPPGLAEARRLLFFHLCGLFPEAKVREAMQRLPMETNPRNLFAYIVDPSNQSTC